MPQIDQRQMLPTGTVLGDRYRIVRYLASGGFGNTYVAEHTLLGVQVAVKEFFMRGTNHRSANGTTVEVSNELNTAVFKAQLEKFRREAKRIFLLHNDHIIHVTDLFDANGTAYYVMDFVNGTSLAEQTRQHPLPEQEVCDVALQMLDALETIHAAGLYHLDIKPGNIMRDSSGHCTLIDFGASKQLSAGEGGTLSSSTMAYTPGYAPLEQVQQQSNNIGPWTDFFALGATIYKLVTGYPPPMVEADDIEPNGRRFSYPATVSAHLRHAISTMMNPARRRRPQNVVEVRALLKALYLKTDNEETIVSSDHGITGETTVGETEMQKDVRELINEMERTRGSSTVNPILQNLIHNMVKVEGGTFKMGEQYSWLGGIGEDNEEHQVTLSSFSIGRAPVTQREWQAVMGNNPSHFKGDDLPVESVSWDDCQEFIRKLNKMTHMDFRLPTEAEWEFAARGGNKSKNYKYSGSNNIDTVAWYNGNSDGKTHSICQKKPNELGLYDMSGNIWEWCQDWYDKNYYDNSPKINPCNNKKASRRVYRGGGWYSDVSSCRIAYRNSFTPTIRNYILGFRLAL